MWTREQVVDWYCGRPGLEVTPEQWRFYEAFGLFRLAVIIQQIWYRYVHGQTHNPAYAGFGPAVAYLEQRCRVSRWWRRLMGMVLLVRHGQASFGADDYDVLSETGVEQSRVLGACAGRAGRRAGGRRARRDAAAARHRDRDGRRRPAGRWPRSWTRGGTSSTTSRVVARAAPTAEPLDVGGPAGFQRLFEEATARWAGG